MKITLNLRVAKPVMTFLLFLFLVPGCDSSGDALSTPTFQPLVFPTSESTPSDISSTPDDPNQFYLTETVNPENFQEDEITSLSRYVFDLEVNYEDHYIGVNQTITYINTTGEELTEIPLWFPATNFPEAIELNNFSSTVTAEIVLPEPANLPWVIYLDFPLSAGDVIDLVIDYSINLPYHGSSFGYTDMQMNLQNWYPFIPPYNGEDGWIYNPYTSIGEYVVSDKADFYVNMRLSGNSNLVIAAAGSEEINNDVVSFTHLNARDFAFSISPRFQKISQTIGNVTIKAFIFPNDEEAGAEVVRNTATALIYFESLFDSKYPHTTLTIIEADFPDGMESDGLYFLSSDYLEAYDGTHRNYMTILSAHETAHQWFYGIVGNNQAEEPWLDEAMCTLGEILYFEEFFPAEKDWWWDYRVISFDPQGSIDISVYEAAALRPYINSVYLQGVRFLHQLRTTTGNEFFITALQNYVLENSDQIVTGDEFLSLFEPFDISGLTSIYFSQ